MTENQPLLGFKPPTKRRHSNKGTQVPCSNSEHPYVLLTRLGWCQTLDIRWIVRFRLKVRVKSRKWPNQHMTSVLGLIQNWVTSCWVFSNNTLIKSPCQWCSKDLHKLYPGMYWHPGQTISSTELTTCAVFTDEHQHKHTKLTTRLQSSHWVRQQSRQSNRHQHSWY